MSYRSELNVVQHQEQDNDIEAQRAALREQQGANIARLRVRAERLEQEAEQKMAAFNRYRQDIAWLTQPANPNRGFGKQRQKIVDRYGVGLEMMAEATKLRERADYLERHGPVIKGDRERQREAERAQLDTLIQKGSRVRDFAFGEGVVVRVNKKTYSVKFPSGSTYARDKTYVRPIRTEEAA